MVLWILDETLNQIGVLDEYKSLIWSKRYNELGDCEIYISANERSIGMLKKGYFITRTDDDMICRIEKIEIDTDTEQGDFLIVTGYDCRKILNQRVIWNQTNFNGTAENFIRKIVNENIVNPSLSRRKVTNFKLGEANGFTETLEIQSTYEYVFDKIKELCITYEYGSSIIFDGTDFIFNIYKGVDRSIDQIENEVVIFSPEFENLISSKYQSDSSNIKTAALVAGQGEGLNRVQEEVDGGTDVNRFEMFVDANDVSAEIPYEDLIIKYPNGRSVVENDIVYYVVGSTKIAILNHVSTPTSGTLLAAPYQVLLHQKGVEALATVQEIVSFDGSVEPNYSYKYGEDYFLGDIVTVMNEYGIKANARIIEVIESDDENGYSIIPTFEFQQISEEPQTINAILTEDNEVMTTEDDEVLLLEETPQLFSSASIEGGKKISELPASTDIYDGCCMPIVTNGETKKIYYSLLKEKISQDITVDAISNAVIDSICV